jgi:pyruvate/2-oxoglutarate dehydrogenase complex dihydrolipoamide dehydrogenase (E3) component
MDSSDVIIIGSGQGGVPLATKLAAAGKRVTVVERAAPGGTCVNIGCTPTKTMIASAQAAQAARTAGALGVRTGEVTVDLAAVVDRKDAIVKRWRQGIERRLSAERITLVRGHGRFVGPRAVEAQGQRLQAETIVINVGARSAVPVLPGLDGVPWLNSTRLLDLRELPAHLLVLGAGYIGCEMGQMFRRFGAAVTLVGRQGRLLPGEDEGVSSALEEAFRAEGIEMRLGAAPEAVERDGTGPVILRLAGGERLRGSHLLVATGRRPNTDDLGCQAAGIRLNEGGFVVVDDQYRTSAEGVYAIGDAIPGPQFTHTSWDDHRRLLAILQGHPKAGRSGALVPYCVFTDPQVAGVGLSEKEARARGVACEKATMPFGDIARAIETGRTAGICQALLDPASERLLGVRLVGAEAGELVHLFVALMLAGAPARALVDGQMVHPTFAEGMQTLLARLPRYK